MFDKIQLMSMVDAVQLLGRARGFFGGLFGNKEADKKASPSSDTKSDEGLPEDLLTEKFTKVDEGHWQQLMVYVGRQTTMAVVRKIINEMKQRDNADNGNRINSFRIGILLMPNKMIDVKQPQSQQQQRRRQQSQTTKQVDPRFTDQDSRVKYLRHLSELIQSEMTAGKSEADAVATIVDYLEADGFLSTGALQQKAKQLAIKTGENLFEETLRLRLGDKYDKIKRQYPRATDKRLRTLRLAALKKRESARSGALKTQVNKRLTRDDWKILVLLVLTIVAVVTYGFMK